MYLDAMFSISSKGTQVMKGMEINRRLDYVLGIDEDESFTKHMIDIGDFGVTTKLFYYLLIIPEFNLLELDDKNMEELYKDEYFTIYYIDVLNVKSLCKKLSTIDSVYVKSTFTTADDIGVNPIYSGYEKYIEFKNLLEDANKKSADLLLVMRIK